MKIKLIKKIIRPSAVLVIIFVMVLLYEIFMFYTYVYSNLSTDTNEVSNQNVVRLDLKAYTKTLELLDAALNFAPLPWNLINTNPFK